MGEPLSTAPPQSGLVKQEGKEGVLPRSCRECTRQGHHGALPVHRGLQPPWTSGSPGPSFSPAARMAWGRRGLGPETARPEPE